MSEKRPSPSEAAPASATSALGALQARICNCLAGAAKLSLRNPDSLPIPFCALHHFSRTSCRPGWKGILRLGSPSALPGRLQGPAAQSGCADLIDAPSAQKDRQLPYWALWGRGGPLLAETAVESDKATEWGPPSYHELRMLEMGTTALARDQCVKSPRQRWEPLLLPKS